MTAESMVYECCCDDVGDDGPSCSSQEIRKARKAHVCGECGDTINPGDRYEYFSGIWEGGWTKHKTCRLCLAIRNDFFQCGWHWGQLRESFRDCYGFDYAAVEEWEPDEVDAGEGETLDGEV